MPSLPTQHSPDDAPAYPSPEELLPHTGRMNWLDRVASHTPEATVCRVCVPADTPLSAADGSLPGFAAIELMAQCAAAHASLVSRGASGAAALDRGASRAGDERARAAGFAAQRILLLGTRALELGRERYAAGEELEVEALAASAASNGLAVLACCVRDASGREVARARLNLFAQA